MHNNLWLNLLIILIRSFLTISAAILIVFTVLMVDMGVGFHRIGITSRNRVKDESDV